MEGSILAMLCSIQDDCTPSKLLSKVQVSTDWNRLSSDYYSHWQHDVHLDSWNKELELTCARNFALKIGTPVGSIVKERCAKYGEKQRSRF